MATCKSCGSTVPDAQKFCTSCGSPIAPAKQTAPPPPQQPPAYPPPPSAYAVPPRPADEAPPKGSIYAPISTLGYIGYFILFGIPIIGQVLLIVLAFGKGGNVNRKALAKAVFVLLVISIVTGIIFSVIGMVFFQAVKKEAANELGVDPNTSIFSWVQGLTGNANGGISADEWAAGEWDGDEFTEAPAGGGGSAQDSGNADGINNFFSAEWPENEFTKHVPKPDFQTNLGGSTTETQFEAVGVGVTIDQMKDYAKKLEQAGFKKDVKTEEMMGTYTFKANNGKGYEVELMSSSLMFDINAITIRKIS